MALADVFDAMPSRRVYKPAQPFDEVRRVMAQGRGSHFDPDMLDAFLVHYDEFCAITRRTSSNGCAGL